MRPNMGGFKGNVPSDENIENKLDMRVTEGLEGVDVQDLIREKSRAQVACAQLVKKVQGATIDSVSRALMRYLVSEVIGDTKKDSYKIALALEDKTSEHMDMFVNLNVVGEVEDVTRKFKGGTTADFSQYLDRKYNK